MPSIKTFSAALLLLALSSVPARAATPTIRGVASKFNSLVTSLATNAFSVNPVTGDTMVVAIQTDSTCAGSPVATTPTDSAGNTYTLLGAETGSGRVALWLASNITGGSAFTVTANSTGGTFCYWVIVAWDLVGGATYNGDFAKAFQSAPVVTPSVTTAVSAPAGSLAIGFTDPCCGSATVTNSLNGWSPTTNSAPSNACCGEINSQSKTVTGTYTSNGWSNVGASAGYRTVTASFSLPSGFSALTLAP